ncbi:hypothetical protein [Alistipes finegoldii]|uniref:hypothetical protein n=1 Tax=Alistipes finegoldii TaxID=214856 RepID=UPI003A8F2E56
MKFLNPQYRKSFIYRGNLYTAIAIFGSREEHRRIAYTRSVNNTPAGYDFCRFKGYAKVFQHNADIYIFEGRFVVPTPFGIADYYPLFATYPFTPPRSRR